MIKTIAYDKEKKAKVRHEEIDIPLYKSAIIVFVKPDNDILEKYWEPHKGAEAFCANYLEHSGEVFMRFPTSRTTYSALAHEASHAATMILDTVGHDISGEFDEPLAYLIGYITQELINIFTKRNIKLYKA